MGVAPTQTGQQRSQKSQERIHRVTPECTEEQVKPDHIGLQLSNCRDQAESAGRVIERPAALYRKTIQFGLSGRDLIGKNRKAEKWIATQFFGEMKSILA